MGQIVYIGLGSNLGDPAAQLQRALEQLARLPGSRLQGRSRFYRSRPLQAPGVPEDQPDYLNAVARVETDLSPLMLLDALQAIEAEQGRVRDGRRWAPRPLDLDLLLYGAEVIQHPRLTVPHPGIAQRDFVLHPLAELAPELEIPGLGPLEALLARCPVRGLQRVEVSR